MTIQTLGEEGITHVGGQEHLEMKAREWYELPPCTIIENQFLKPLLVSYDPHPLLPCPDNPYDPESQYNACKMSPRDIPDLAWPSPHFREAITAFTIKAGETLKLGQTAYVLSTHHRLQPIDTTGVMFSELSVCGEEPIDPVEPIEPLEIGFYTNLLGPGTYTQADFAGGTDVLTFAVSAETEDAVANLSGKNGVAIPILCGEAKGKSIATYDQKTCEYIPVTDVVLEVISGEVEIIGECLG